MTCKAGQQQKLPCEVSLPAWQWSHYTTLACRTLSPFLSSHSTHQPSAWKHSNATNVAGHTFNVLRIHAAQCPVHVMLRAKWVMQVPDGCAKAVVLQQHVLLMCRRWCASLPALLTCGGWHYPCWFMLMRCCLCRFVCRALAAGCVCRGGPGVAVRSLADAEVVYLQTIAALTPAVCLQLVQSSREQLVHLRLLSHV